MQIFPIYCGALDGRVLEHIIILYINIIIIVIIIFIIIIMPDKSVIYAAPTEWNKLDGPIRKITNFDSFKREIKTTLFLSYFDL